MTTHIRLERGGRSAARIIIGAALIVGAAAGCKVSEPVQRQPGPVDRLSGAAGADRVLLPELVGYRH